MPLPFPSIALPFTLRIERLAAISMQLASLVWDAFRSFATLYVPVLVMTQPHEVIVVGHAGATAMASEALATSPNANPATNIGRTIQSVTLPEDRCCAFPIVPPPLEMID